MSNIERINPLVNATAQKERSKETAKHNTLERVDQCPICEAKMQVVTANKIPSYVCLAHRICLPTQDD